MVITELCGTLMRLLEVALQSCTLEKIVTVDRCLTSRAVVPNTPPLKLSPHFSKVLGVADACNFGVAGSAETAPTDGFPK
jgi:hypothetical protein